MVILITGGAGFIGSHLCDFLLNKGHSIICVDNLITGKILNIKHNLNNKRFEFIKHDVIKPLNIKGKIDHIFHLASPASPVDYLKYPIETLVVGSTGTKNMLDLAKKKKAKFILASTSEVYGDPLISPQHEEYFGNVNPVGPRAVYDEAKRYAEAITSAYAREYHIKIGIARIFNTFGPRMNINDGRIVPNIINQALKDKPLTIYGNGKQTRSFCYISDTVKGLYSFMKSNISTPVNIGSSKEMTIFQLSKLILDLTNSSSKITYKPLPIDDPKKRQPNIQKAKKTLGWSPKIPLVTGLKLTINSYKKGHYMD